MFTSNHAKLIKDCYPPKPEGLPSAVSNSLGKLTFYAAGRPKKLPKVSAALLERAQKDSKSTSGPKGRAGLAVTIDIYKGLVTECRTDLRVFGEQALRVVEMGLTRKEGSKRDPEMEARAASLFRAVATFTTSPFVGLSDAQGKQYMRCLSVISSMAQLGKDDAVSRAIALDALQGAVESESLYSQSASYESTVEEIMPALLYNVVGVPSSVLRKYSNVSDENAGLHSFGSLESRKSADVSVPAKTPSATDLAAAAFKALRTISRLSHGGQLSSELSAVGAWLDHHQKGSLWQDRDLIENLGTTLVAASPVQYRSAVVTWWAEQVSGIDDAESTAKSETLLSTLTAILRGETSLVGLGIGSVLGSLISLVVRRAPLGDDDPLANSVLSAVSSLASSRIYYVDQVNDVVADLIESIRSVRDGTGVGARLMGRSEKKRATRRLVGALREVLLAASASDGQVQIAVPAKNGDARSISEKGNGSAASEVRSKKEDVGDQYDAMGRPVMHVQSAGNRSRVGPDTFGESLFLLTDPDATTRRDYERALLAYLEQELQVMPVNDAARDGPVIDPTHQLEGFFRRLHVAVYELATSSALTSFAMSPDLTLDGGLDRSSSRLSRRQSVSSGRAVSAANAVDYSALAAIVQTVQARKSPLAVSEGVPMLLTLYLDADRWANESAEKAQACREVALHGLRAVGEVWSIGEVTRAANDILARLQPSVLPRLQSKYKSSSVPDFASQATGAAPSLPAGSVIDAILASNSLQDATGPGLVNTLNSPWTAHRDQKRVNRKSTLISNGSRSVTNLTNSLRVTSASSPDRPHSLGAPSLADLQSSLGQPSSLRGDRTSATPSIASTGRSVATGNTQRRSQRKGRDQVLSSLQLSQPPSRASSISKVPYVG